MYVEYKQTYHLNKNHLYLQKIKTNISFIEVAIHNDIFKQILCFLWGLKVKSNK